MRKILPFFAAVSALAMPLQAAPSPDQVGFDVVEGLTTEVGQRLAATEAEARARDWAVVRLKKLGFANVHIETYEMPVWLRGAEMAEIVSPAPQKLAVAALGYSGATPAQGITAEVVGFPTLQALRAAPDSMVRGKIVFVWHRMGVTMDGSSYGENSPVRRASGSIAASKGAAAVLIRSVGTDHHRLPHTGVQQWDAGVTPIPTGALSVPDSEQLERLLALGKPVKLHLTMTPRMAGTGMSGNVIAEVPGRDPKAGIVLIGGHLDSWDLGTGAFDDAAGIGITTAAAKRMLDGAKPKRTIRLVWFGAEEVGGFGGAAYAKAHGSEKHVLAAEADLGGDRIWQLRTSLADPKSPVIAALRSKLAPVGVGYSTNAAHGGTDVEAMIDTGVLTIDLQNDATRYFDLHHTADDTLDKIDRTQFAQAIDAWTAMLEVIANTDQPLTPMAQKH
jgi:carboxypeptidase Q